MIMAYYLHGPNSIITSIAAIAIGFLFPFMVNFFGITSTTRLEQQRKRALNEPVLELPSDLEDDVLSVDLEEQERSEPSIFAGMERYVLIWSVITFALILMLPAILPTLKTP